MNRVNWPFDAWGIGAMVEASLPDSVTYHTQGINRGLTGIGDPYEAPLQPEVKLDGERDPDSLANDVLSYLEKAGVIPSLAGRRNTREGRAVI